MIIKDIPEYIRFYNTLNHLTFTIWQNLAETMNDYCKTCKRQGNCWELNFCDAMMVRTLDNEHICLNKEEVSNGKKT
jgi:hypothetical protein